MDINIRCQSRQRQNRTIKSIRGDIIKLRLRRSFTIYFRCLIIGLPAIGCSPAICDEVTSSRVTHSESHALIEGANRLFVEHCFFLPVAATSNRLAMRNEFPSHQAKWVIVRGNWAYQAICGRLTSTENELKAIFPAAKSNCSEWR